MMGNKWVLQPHNGQEGQQCPAGCIFEKCENTYKLKLVGDCRAPGMLECALDQRCASCNQPASKVGELHEDDELCRACEDDWVQFTREMAT